MGGASVLLVWQPMDTNEVGHALFTDVRASGGGAPLPLYNVVKIFTTAFKPGTPLVAVTSSLPTVEALASRSALLLINKHEETARLRLGQRRVSLKGYEVRLFPH